MSMSSNVLKFSYKLDKDKLRRLSKDAQRQVMCFFDADVSSCIHWNGYEDEICRKMQAALDDMLEYLNVELYDCHEVV